MKWNNLHQDAPPGHDDLVLLCIDGVYYLTFFDAKYNVFRLKDDIFTHFDIDKQSAMYWLEIDHE